MRKGIVSLFLALILIYLVAPTASAAGTVVSCDEYGNEKNIFNPEESVYVKASGLEADQRYRIIIQADPVEEEDRLYLVRDPSFGLVFVTTNESGYIPPTNIWDIRSRAYWGDFDIVVQKIPSRLVYDSTDDGIDSPIDAGFSIPRHLLIWDLDSEVVSSGYEMEMKDGSSDDGQSGTVTAGSSVMWIADEAMQNDVNFSSDLWLGRLELSSYHSDIPYIVEIGIWNGDTFVPYGEFEGICSGFVESFYMQGEEFTVSDGEYVAFMFTNMGAQDIIITTDGDSSLVYTGDQRSEPVPEVSSIVLSATGLLALFGYVRFSRRKGNY
ncbi:MAG: hypothetical protein SVK08_07400 [Halobacteriota archaeon]|nr:hypothetical protein [Halobacteriota archaeon]